MEMTFPHFAPHGDSHSRIDHEALIATVVARQANSRTVRALRRAELMGRAGGSEAEQRIHYFARRGSQKMAVRGAFWRNADKERTSEQVVYQAGSTNIKVREVEHNGTGEQLNHAGHGALRKL